MVLELYQLKGFQAVAELANLTRAAERLHISQPALSSQVKALEDELGVTLFERTPTGMALTQGGRQLLARAESVLEAAQALLSEAAALKGEVGGRARVGTLADPEFIRVGELLGAMTRDHPMIGIEFRHMVTGEAFEAVLAGDLDCSFYYGPRSSPRMARLALREFGYRIAAPIAWRSEIRKAGWREIAALPWIIPPAISTHADLARAMFDANNVAPEKVVEADNEAVVSSLVVSGIGLALMREDQALARAKAKEICLWRDIRLPTTLEFIHLAERAREDPIAALTRVLRAVWNLAG
jgi:DNA-binding transcriptional LysR family regulator